MTDKRILASAVLALVLSITPAICNAGGLIEQTKSAAPAQGGAASPALLVKVWASTAGSRTALQGAPLQQSDDGTVTPEHYKPGGSTASKAGSFLKHLAIGIGASTGHPAAQVAAQAAGMAEAKAMNESTNPSFLMKATWALSLDSSNSVLSGRRPTFDVAYAAAPQLNGTALAPVVVKLMTSDQGLIAGTTQLRMSKQNYSTLKFSENVIASHVQRSGTNRLKLVLDEDLQPGQYAVAFRPSGDTLTLDMTAAASLIQSGANGGAAPPWQMAWPFTVK